MRTGNLISREDAVREALGLYRDAQQSVRKCREAEDDFGFLAFSGQKEAFRWMAMVLMALPAAGEDAHAKEPNEPLTQAALDSMDYDKVWIDYEDGTGEWALVCDGVIYSIDTLEGAGLDFGEYMQGEMLEPHGYKVYRRPPEGEA